MSLVKTHRASASTEYYPKVQPRSSSERDNSFLLHTALKAASTDMAHRLLNYASLDKMDCEASCILIALANHNNHHSEPKKVLFILYKKMILKLYYLFREKKKRQ